MADGVGSLRGYFRRLDKTLALLAAAAVFYGCLIQFSVYRAGFITRRALLTQWLTAGAGYLVMLLMAELDYRRLAAGWKFHLPATLGLTLLTFTNLPIVYRPEGSDDSAWLRLGPLSVQPGEFFKFSFILTLAWHFDRVSERLDSPREVLLLCLHGAAGCLLIFVQGDMGSAVIFFFIFAAMAFASGLSWKYIAAGAGAVAAAAPAVWFSGLLPDYIKNRFLVLGDLEGAALGDAYQQLMGRRILGSGQAFGRGLFSDSFQYVYAIENDLVLAHIGQALGFAGTAAALLLLTAICGKILLVSRSSRDYLGMLTAAGVFAMVFFQTALNAGMVMGLLPVIGITLPLFSQGGSSLAVTLLLLGLCMSVSAGAGPGRRGKKKGLD